jgi:hypothetical protein
MRHREGRETRVAKLEIRLLGAFQVWRDGLAVNLAAGRGGLRLPHPARRLRVTRSFQPGPQRPPERLRTRHRDGHHRQPRTLRHPHVVLHLVGRVGRHVHGQ